jgi:hypothetical protein
VSTEQSLELLRSGTLAVEGRLIDASNATLYCIVTLDGLEAACVYKPVAGERPLWDFPDGTLAFREVAAYEVSVASGWDLVPPTVLRDGPYGLGMCQLWVDVDEEVDLVALSRSEHPDLRAMAVFDAVVNNADRKGGHLLPRLDGKVQGVDHGVCFSVEDKLRTLLWQWRGRRLPAELLEPLERLDAELAKGRTLHRTLSGLLARTEVTATARRLRRLLATAHFPEPSADWPAIPWPPY